MVFEIYTVGFGDMIRLGLDLTAMLFNYMLASPLVAIAIIVGVGAVAVQSLARGKIEVMQLVMALALFLVMFVPRADVTVVDILGDENSSANGVVIEDVPLGLALAGAVTSAAATWMSEAYQTIFISDNQTGAQFTNHQFAFPLRMMMHLRDVEACDLGVNFCRNLQTYTRICYQPAMAANAFDQEDVYQNPERVFDAAAIQAMGAIEYLNEDGATGIRSCAEAGEDLEAYLDGVFEEGTKAHEHLSNYIRARMGDAPPEAGVENSIRVDPGVVRQVAESILGAAAEQRNITVTHIARQVHNAAQVGGFGAEASALWLNQTMERSRLISSVEASSMLRMLLIMMGLMQFLFIVMTPAIAIVALVKGGAGYKVYGGWILLAVWSSMFLVTVTVIDFWAQRAVQTRFTDLYAGSTEYSALSVPGLQGAYAIVADILQTAYKFLSAAPLVTLVMLTGSMFPLAMLARGFGGGAEASNLAGTQAVGDKAAMQMPSEYAPPQNFSGWADTRAASLASTTSDVSYQEALQGKVSAAEELRESASKAATSAFKTASDQTFGNMQQGIKASTSVDEFQSQIQDARSWMKTVLNDSSAVDQLSDRDIHTLTRGWSAEAGFGLPSKIGKVTGLSLGVKGHLQEQDSASEEELSSVASRLNQALNVGDGGSISISEVERITDQWTSQTSGSESQSWSQVESHVDTYETASAQVESAKREIASSAGFSSTTRLDSNTIQQVESNLRESGAGGVAGFLDSKLNTYGEDVRSKIESRGGLPDLTNPETADANLAAALNLSNIASDEELPSDVRYAASGMLSSLFESLVDRNAAAFGEAELTNPQLGPVKNITGVDGHIKSAGQRTRAEAIIGSAEGQNDDRRPTAGVSEEARENAWSAFAQSIFSESALEQNKALREGIQKERDTLDVYASSIVPPGMHGMQEGGYRNMGWYNTPNEAMERAESIDQELGTGQEHQRFVAALVHRHLDEESGEFDRAGFSHELGQFYADDSLDSDLQYPKAMNSGLIADMVNAAPSASTSDATAWIWANGGIDELALSAAPEGVSGQIDFMNEQASSSEAVSHWLEMTRGSEELDPAGARQPLLSDGVVSQEDMARYAFNASADPRFSEAVHAGAVHNAIAQHGDFSAEEIGRIADLEKAGDSDGARRELFKTLGIAPFGDGTFDAHARIERELDPGVIREEAMNLGSTASTSSGENVGFFEKVLDFAMFGERNRY